MNSKLEKAGGEHRSHARARLGIGSVALALLLVCPAQAQNFDSALASAADAIAGAIQQAGKKRVAVIDFDQIEGQVTALGRFLAEEISADLAEHPRPFAVIDRANLQSILAEHALSMSGLVNPENAKRLGQIAGVDALVLGTYTDFGESYRLSLKAIATDTAEMVASARANVPKTNALVQLATELVDQRELKPKVSGEAEPGPKATPTIQAAARSVLYETGVEKGGFAGWSLSPDWKHLNGMLVDDGTADTGAAVAPYNPRSADYAVEAEIRVIQEGDFRNGFSIFVRAGNKAGYQVAVGKLNGPVTRICYLNAGGLGIADNSECKTIGLAFEPGADWHKYRAEIKGNAITFLIDDAAVTSAIDNRFLSPGRVGLLSMKYQLEVRNFRVISLEQHAAAPRPADATGGATDLAANPSGGVPKAASEASLATSTPSSGDGAEPKTETPSTGAGARTPQPDPGVVRDVQRKLQRLGFPPGPVDGVWGGKTEEAVKSFQRAHDLKPTGAVDQQLLAALDAATSHQRDVSLAKEVTAVRAESSNHSDATDETSQRLISGAINALLGTVLSSASGQGHRHK
jgi:Putative peptidoglycan binding domain/Curli production assembly/transport component CsgG